MKMSNKMYDILKAIAQYVIPGLGVLYAALSKIWGLPYTANVLATLTALDTFLGTLLGISSYQYNKQEDNQEDNQDSKTE